ncbi:sensor histidine kinase [Sphingomonas crusticola]|uniref:sensor histidine kinase n=1 Tax=Sphingomonas crusticola TaxID=1697973 RepID=UPI000E27EF8B|nr:HAMP domain-containing sensor histidine kinase [Sphingomonas crusticola]
MRLMPRSLFGRLLGTAIVAVIAALAFAAFAIGNVLEHFVMRGLDDRLDAQIAIVARAVRPDGSVDPVRAIDLPPFDRPGSGWSWEIRAPGGHLRSASVGGGEIAPPGPLPTPPHWHDVPSPRPFDGRDASGLRIHGRVASVPTTRGNAEILAVGPRAMIERPLRAAMAPLLLSLLVLGAALALAILVQLRVGLRPLVRLRATLADVRAGRRTHVDATEPSELLPLVEELNALIDANRSALVQARGHVANLAHGLKTPLAALRLDVDAMSQPLLVRHIDRIDAQIRHHLGRARAASPAGAGAGVTKLAPHVIDLADALGRIHAERAIRANILIDDALMVRCDPQDLDEMVGNLLDNAWRWARREVEIVATDQGRMVNLRISDDGPGISQALLSAAIEPGRRLDEAGEGHGFGLSITRELAELHGGTLMLANRVTSGLVATLCLPSGIL